MKILLLGEYSNVHWTLAEGLREIGHNVTVVSDGDVWKNYKRDITLKRQFDKPFSALRYLKDVVKLLPKLRGYDVVQIINPMFLELKAERIRPFYQYLRRHNKKIIMAAFGMDYYWVKTCLDCKTFRYSDFNIGSWISHNESNDLYIRDWLHGEKGKLNQWIAQDCDGIVTGLYEYDACYRPIFPQKTCFIPFPINPENVTPLQDHPEYNGIRFFIGIQRERSEYKGTDIMLRALERLKELVGNKLDIKDIRVNRLYEIYPRNVFCAFYCRDFYGITYTDQFHEFSERYFPNTDSKVYCQRGLTEAEARTHLRGAIARRYLKTTASANINVRPHQVYLVSDIR